MNTAKIKIRKTATAQAYDAVEEKALASVRETIEVLIKSLEKTRFTDDDWVQSAARMEEVQKGLLLVQQRRATKATLQAAPGPINEREYSTLARTAAGRFRSALQMVSGYGPNLSCAQVASLLTVAMFPGRNLNQLAHLASLSKSTMSRHMLDLSSYRRSRKGLEGEDRSRSPGLGLIDVQTPPDNLRERQYTLTQRGTALINILETILAK